MTGQLDHLAEVSQFPNVSLRVVPVSAGYHPGSGDTIVCPEMEDLARGCDVLVHEAARGALLRRMGERWQRVADYHADTVELGALAARAGVRVLVLTHLIPGPATPAEEAAFADDVREGGFAGEVVVGRDLTTVWLAGGDAQPEVTPGIAPEVAVDLRAPRPSAAGARDPGDGGAPLASVK